MKQTKIQIELYTCVCAMSMLDDPKSSRRHEMVFVK